MRSISADRNGGCAGGYIQHASMYQRHKCSESTGGLTPPIAQQTTIDCYCLLPPHQSRYVTHATATSVALSVMLCHSCYRCSSHAMSLILPLHQSCCISHATSRCLTLRTACTDCAADRVHRRRQCSLTLHDTLHTISSLHLMLLRYVYSI